ncbi:MULTISPECIES: 3-phosphoshikimate 1-carboxyvinyltransferase [Bacillaceae]|uniref:3-phosphoshikimate 1-carboxyvinyltransferase n=1 Tax=Bacillaceae TaxID=186817 RepID=UPI001C56704D|nr:3-phosphoshikimate 1-carboxyvinyltransferase [Rossellomorea sp. YZS02]MBW3113313.1 3-phosphoshikimate 1-carboxyvinyltransferase [Bacillus sp. MCCB 382]MDX8345556.1 3-phosphoshikimate 1-carboxyvinyltransferase [Rossellomorea sp. YZS02]
MVTMKKLSNPKCGLIGEIQVPGDKSISHRSIMFGSVAEGKTVIHNFLMGEDCLSTISCFRKLGVEIEIMEEAVIVHGKGWDHLEEPLEILDAGNSGTTTRLIMGILAGRPFHSVLIGDSSIAKRPMKRVTEPLKLFGTQIDGRSEANFTPLSIRGGNLKGIHYALPVASAQVKSALILAGLQAEGVTEIIEPEQTRNHTENMIIEFGGKIEKHGDTIKVEGGQVLKGTKISVPGDISSAAFFMVAAAIVPDSSVRLKNVGLNETRIGIVEVMKKMGASIEIEEHSKEGEPVGDILVQYSDLSGIEIGGDLIPSLIDEIPIIALLATQAKGKTVIKDAEELKVKETNRIDAVVKELGKLGASIQGTDDGMIIEGKTPLHGGEVHSWGDHRIGMTLAVASLLTDSDVLLEDAEAVKISYPNFFEHINQLLRK